MELPPVTAPQEPINAGGNFTFWNQGAVVVADEFEPKIHKFSLSARYTVVPAIWVSDAIPTSYASHPKLNTDANGVAVAVAVAVAVVSITSQTSVP